MDKLIAHDRNNLFVWPDAVGQNQGIGLTPLYKTVPQAVRTDPDLYECLALIDTLRIGSVREKNIAVDELKKESVMINDENRKMIVSVAKSLSPLTEFEKMVFVGGAVVGLLITDKATLAVRPTMDVDIIIGVKSRLKYYRLEQKLRDLGFKQTHDINCRWLINDVTVDIMPTSEEILGFSNKWYPVSIKESILHPIDNDTTINLISPPCFIATKIEAFEGRGEIDFLGSRDIEDIINVIDGRPELVENIKNTPKSLKAYLVRKFRAFNKKNEFHDSIKGSLRPDIVSQERYYIIKERIEEINSIKI